MSCFVKPPFQNPNILSLVTQKILTFERLQIVFSSKNDSTLMINFTITNNQLILHCCAVFGDHEHQSQM